MEDRKRILPLLPLRDIVVFPHMVVPLFIGLDGIVERRTTKKMMGFGADIVSRAEKNVGKLLEAVQPEDLIRFGLIPEFVGRLPVVATLGDLDAAALMRILTEPRNALIKQYRKLVQFEDVILRFTEEALRAIAQQALEHNTGARGLRAIIEDLMLETLFDLPSMAGVKEVVINEQVVLRKETPLLVYEKAS